VRDRTNAAKNMRKMQHAAATTARNNHLAGHRRVLHRQVLPRNEQMGKRNEDSGDNDDMHESMSIHT